jgi:hypothetical protein
MLLIYQCPRAFELLLQNREAILIRFNSFYERAARGKGGATIVEPGI